MSVRVDYANGIDNSVADLDVVYITAAGYVRYPFKGVSRDSAWGWDEAVFGGELTRSTDRVLSNIDDVEFGFVARCELSFKYMNMQDYLVLAKMLKQRTCVVDFYNRDTGERVSQEMAFTNTERGKVYKLGTDALGMLDVSIKLVATNRDDKMVNLIKSNFTISYNNNGGSGSIASATDVQYASVYEIADGSAFNRIGYALVGFNTKADGTGGAYLPNQHITVFDNLTLYAQWQQA